eukprot:scaffold288328_cov28-Tisochrysis_lutea.AAC.1
MANGEWAPSRHRHRAIARPISPTVRVVGASRVVTGRIGAKSAIGTAGGSGPYAVTMDASPTRLQFSILKAKGLTRMGRELL